jgi:hypothetical protein
VIYYMIVFYFHNMLSLSYPHEKVPWAALPTKIPLLIEFVKFMILLIYIENTIAAYIIPYANIVLSLIFLFILN